MESESDTHNPLELEKSLGAFDMFVLHGQLGDMNDVSTMAQLQECVLKIRTNPCEIL